MRFWLLFLVFVPVFSLGWFSSYVFSSFATSGYTEMPFSSAGGRPSPFDRVDESQISIFPDRVVLNISDVQWASYADTHSMEPVLKAGANGLELIPQSEKDVHVGDVVAYSASWSDGLVVHRVVEQGSDEQGTYYVLKGDNNSSADPGRVRFSQVRYVLIGVIY